MNNLMDALMKSNNPVGMMQSMYGNNPMFQRAMAMAQGKTPDQLREIALNLCQQRGMSKEEAERLFHSFGL